MSELVQAEEMGQGKRKHSRLPVRIVAFGLIVFLVLCSGGPALLLTMPDLPWTTRNLPINASVCGEWQVLARPNLGLDVAGNGLNGMGAGAGSDIWLVGWTENRDDSKTRPVMVHWDGAHLYSVSGPIGNCYSTGLDDIAVVAPDDAWAVGWDCVFTYIQHWDGSRWTYVPGPSPAPLHGSLEAVAAARDDVWAVGCCDPNRDAPLVIRWDGAAWKFVQHPIVPNSTLHDVTVIAPDDVWAVGTHDKYFSLADGDGSHTLTTHWDGRAWQVVPSPNLCKGKNTLVSVAATGPNDVWAVGSCTDDTTNQYLSPRQTLVEHWDGKYWSIVSSPNPTLRHYLTSVVAITSDDAWAFGSHTNNTRGLIDHTLAMHWDGKQWSAVPSPNFSDDQGFSDAVAISKNEVWAVGSSEGRNVMAARFIRSACPTPGP